MIGRIAGQIVYKADDHVLIDVRGVGYIVYVTDRVRSALPGPGEAAALYTDLLVREDLLQLFGFPTLVEKEWHRLLMSVQGPKLAQRIVTELKDKAPAVMAMGQDAPTVISDAVTEPVVSDAPVPQPVPVALSASAQAEALSALGNLGYAPGEAAAAVAEAASEDPQADTAGLIRAALKLLAPKG